MESLNRSRSNRLASTSESPEKNGIEMTRLYCEKNAVCPDWRHVDFVMRYAIAVISVFPREISIHGDPQKITSSITFELRSHKFKNRKNLIL
jgi:hypothetical protein